VLLADQLVRRSDILDVEDGKYFFQHIDEEPGYNSRSVKGANDR
jgi:hypothetical protein